VYGELPWFANALGKDLAAMEMSEDEILEEADRIRARRGLRVARECARCSASFLASGDEQYCSGECQTAAACEASARSQNSQVEGHSIPPSLPGESNREYLVRIAGRPPTVEEEEVLAAMDRIAEIWDKIGCPLEDSTELIRRMREERAEYLGSL
jgi:ribosomal protein S27AE